MAPLSRFALRAPLSRAIRPSYTVVPRRYAGTDYGSRQSGHEQGINEDNPKKHLEHPGPESPATKAGNGPKSNSGPKDGAEPKFNQPKSAAENESEDVRKHNEEMEQRSEKTANQLSEDDNKVDKKFWQGT